MFVRYLQARMNREIIERSYRYYVTDSLRLIPQFMYLTNKWSELFEGREEEKTASEIIEDVVSRLESGE